MSAMGLKAEGGTVWILFANGESSRVNISLHRGKSDRSRPADAYVVTGGGLSRSARRAAESVYNWLRESGRNPDQFVAGFDIEGADSTMAGESGGLAFALALSARLLNRPVVAMAATGEITGAHYPAPVGRVDGINEKLRAAAELLGDGQYLCFPRENEHEINSELIKDIRNRGIRLTAVDSVAEALETVFEVRSGKSISNPGKRPNIRMITMALSLACLMLAMVILGSWWFESNNAQGVEENQDQVQTESLTVEDKEPGPSLDRVEEDNGDRGFD